MSLLDDLADPNYRPHTGPACTIEKILSTVDDKTGALIKAALANPYARSTDIALAVTERGHQLSAHVVQRHRRGACRCARES